jgi:hypothetical protein
MTATHDGAGVIEAAEDTESFTRERFARAMRCGNLVAAFAFWRHVERMADPDTRTRLHARGLLRAMAMQQFRECQGVALSAQHAEAFRYCGLEPIRIAPPGE